MKKDISNGALNSTHYTRHVDVDLDELMNQTKAFVLEIERIIDSLNQEKIATLQKKLKNLVS